MIKEKSNLYTKIEAQKHVSAWDKGVNLYALELVEFLENEDLWATKENMLNGADDWSMFSYGANALIYNGDIAERLCPPSEFKSKKEGDLPPNSRESWLDVQSRALFQASSRVIRAAKA
jgi:hypothetical protein